MIWHRSLEPKVTKNRPSIKLDMQVLQKEIKANQDSYQREIAAKLSVSQALKKTFKHPKADQEKQKIFMKMLEKYLQEVRQIVYGDESGFILVRKNVPM